MNSIDYLQHKKKRRSASDCRKDICVGLISFDIHKNT